MKQFNLQLILAHLFSVGSLVVILLLCGGPLVSAQEAQVNVALGQPAVASSTQGGNTPNQAVDANPGTRWESFQGIDPQWIYVDLGTAQDISRVKLTWETALGRDYQIQVSDDAEAWQDLRVVTGNEALVNDLTELEGRGRYVRMYGTARGTGYGYSLFEFEVYGPDLSPQVSLTSPVNNAVYSRNSSITLAAEAMAQSGKEITRVDFFSDATLLGSATVVCPPINRTFVQFGLTNRFRC